MPHIPARDKRERERERKRKRIERQGATPVHVHTCIPGSIIDNKCVTLIIATYSCKRERERERERKRKGIEGQGAIAVHVHTHNVRTWKHNRQ